MAVPLTSSAAGFLMHTSSFSPLRDSQLESSSPSHPLFAHTSGQKSHGSIGQHPWEERKAMLSDAEVLNAEAGQQQADRPPNTMTHDRLVSSNSPVWTAPVKGSKQQAVAQVRSQAASRHACRADHACSAPAAQPNRAGSSRAHWSKATEDSPEQGGNAVIAQYLPASSFETASSGTAGSKSGSAVMVAAACSTSTCKPSSSLDAAGCSPCASCSAAQMAGKASKPTNCCTPRPGSAVDIEGAKVAAAARQASIAAEAVSCHSASSLLMLTDHLARQSPFCKGTNQPSCSGPEEVLSALNSADLAFLVAAKPLQQQTDLPRRTVPLDSQRFQTELGSVSRSSCIHISTHMNVDVDDDLVLHDSKSEAAVASYRHSGGTDSSFDKAEYQSHAGSATAQGCISPYFTSTVLGKQRWLGDSEAKALEHDHASSLLNSCASLDSLYADNDWN